MYTIVLLCLGVQTCSRITETPILLFKQPVHGFQIQILVCIFSITLFLTRTLAMFSQCSHMTLSYSFNHFLTYSRFVSHILRICSNNFPYILPNYDQNMFQIFPTCSHVFPIFFHIFPRFYSKFPTFFHGFPTFRPAFRQFSRVAAWRRSHCCSSRSLWSIGAAGGADPCHGIYGMPPAGGRKCFYKSQ